MISVCAWCAKAGLPSFLEEREPYENTDVTHGICPAHERAWLEKAERTQRARMAAGHEG